MKRGIMLKRRFLSSQKKQNIFPLLSEKLRIWIFSFVIFTRKGEIQKSNCVSRLEISFCCHNLLCFRVLNRVSVLFYELMVYELDPVKKSFSCFPNK